MSVLLKSVGQGVSSAPEWKARTNLDKIRQRQEERADERLEMDKTQQEMKRTELINRLEAGLKQQEREVMDKELERIVYSDPEGSVAKGYITPSDMQQKWPDLWQQTFDPAYKMDLDAKRLKAMYEANEEARKQQKHEYDMNRPYSGTDKPKTQAEIKADIISKGAGQKVSTTKFTESGGLEISEGLTDINALAARGDTAVALQALAIQKHALELSKVGKASQVDWDIFREDNPDINWKAVKISMELSENANGL